MVTQYPARASENWHRIKKWAIGAGGIAVVLGSGWGLAGCGALMETSNALPVSPLPPVSTTVEPRVQTRWLWGHHWTQGGAELGQLHAGWAGNRLYIPAHRDQIYRVDPATGAIQSVARPVHGVHWQTGIAAEPDAIWVGTAQGEILAIAWKGDQAQVQWRVALNSPLATDPAPHTHQVAVLTQDGIVRVLDRATGQQIWAAYTDLPQLSLTPSGVLAWEPDGTALYAGLPNGHVVKWRSTQGTVIWDMAVAPPQGSNPVARLVDVRTRPLISRDQIWIANYQGRIVSLDPRTGALQWSHPFSTLVDLAWDPVAARLYGVSTDGTVHAWDAKQGQPLWTTQNLMGRLTTGPMAAGGLIWVGDREGYVHGLDPHQGAVVAQYRIGKRPVVDPLGSSAPQSDGRIYGFAWDTSGHMGMWESQEARA